MRGRACAKAPAPVWAGAAQPAPVL